MKQREKNKEREGNKERWSNRGRERETREKRRLVCMKYMLDEKRKRWQEIVIYCTNVSKRWRERELTEEKKCAEEHT